jgi:hypothetical protein
MAFPFRFRDLIGGDGAEDERVRRVQHLKHHGDEPSCHSTSSGVEQCALDFFRRQIVFRDVGGVAALVARVIPIDQGVPQVHAAPSNHRLIVF